jgi:hypothetical protein
MKSFESRSVFGAVIIVAAALLACKKGGSKEVKASCDMRGSGNSGSSAICIDFHVEPNDKVRAICSEDKGYTLAQKPCDTATALGGCERGNLTNWYYSSSRHSSADDVKKECPGDFVAAGAK